MSEDGVYSQYKEGETPKHAPASPYLRLSPRQLTVQPGTNQTVRIQYRPGKDMKPGEYRSHLLFSVVPEFSGPTSVSTIKGEGEKEGMTLKLSMQMSVVISEVAGHQLSEPPVVNIASVEPMPAMAPGQFCQTFCVAAA